MFSRPFIIKAVLAAILLLLLAVLGVVYMLRAGMIGSSSMGGDTLAVRPNMTVTIPILFDAANQNGYYDWTLADDTEDGKEIFVETNNLAMYGQNYQFLLATKKADDADQDYTVPQYLTLTLTGPDTDGNENTIVYVDLDADGDLDSVFLNDEMLTQEGALTEAQNQYMTELVLARDHMLDAMSI